jgi:hypothetical protein
MFRSPRVGRRVAALTTVPLFMLFTTSVSAQTAAPTPDPNPGSLTLTGSFDLVSDYTFRGIRQHSTGVALWPVADLGIGGLVGIGFSC